MSMMRWDELPWVGEHPSGWGWLLVGFVCFSVLTSLFERPRLRHRLSKAEQSLAATRRMLQRT